MQTPAHLLVGVQIDRIVPDVEPGSLRKLLVAFLSVYSHALLDALSALTYHPPDPSPKDRFWLSYHAVVAVLSVRVWVKNQERHKLAMACSLLPDLDWLLSKLSKLNKNKTSCWRQPVLHSCLFNLLYSMPPFWLLNNLPNLREKKIAAIPELIFYLIFSGGTSCSHRKTE